MITYTGMLFSLSAEMDALAKEAGVVPKAWHHWDLEERH